MMETITYCRNCERAARVCSCGAPDFRTVEVWDIDVDAAQTTAERKALAEALAREAEGELVQTGIYGQYRPERGFAAGLVVCVCSVLLIALAFGVLYVARVHHGR